MDVSYRPSPSGSYVLPLFLVWRKSCLKTRGPATSGEREDEESKDSYYSNSASLMAETDMKCGQSCKTKSPLCPQTQRGEAAYSSVSVLDDVANDALS